MRPSKWRLPARLDGRTGRSGGWTDSKSAGGPTRATISTGGLTCSRRMARAEPETELSLRYVCTSVAPTQMDQLPAGSSTSVPGLADHRSVLTLGPSMFSG